jgi:hypothetical protein
LGHSDSRAGESIDIKQHTDHHLAASITEYRGKYRRIQGEILQDTGGNITEYRGKYYRIQGEI